MSNDVDGDYAAILTSRHEQALAEKNRRDRVHDHVIVYKKPGMRRPEIAPPLLDATASDRVSYLGAPDDDTPDAVDIDLVKDRWATATAGNAGAVTLQGNDDTLKALAHSELKKLMGLKHGQREVLASMTPKAAKEFMAALE